MFYQQKQYLYGYFLDINVVFAQAGSLEPLFCVAMSVCIIIELLGPSHHRKIYIMNLGCVVEWW